MSLKTISAEAIIFWWFFINSCGKVFIIVLRKGACCVIIIKWWRDGRYGTRYVDKAGKRLEKYGQTLPEARSWIEGAKCADQHKNVYSQNGMKLKVPTAKSPYKYRNFWRRIWKNETRYRWWSYLFQTSIFLLKCGYSLISATFYITSITYKSMQFDATPRENGVEME